MDRCEGKVIIRLTANYNRLLNGVDGLITFISGNRRRQSLLVRFSRLSRYDPRRSTSNIYRARLSVSNCNRLAFVVGKKLAIVFANVFHALRRLAFRGESQREKRERKKTIGRGWIEVEKGSFVKRVCRYHESSSSSSLLQSMQPCKNAPPSCIHPPPPSLVSVPSVNRGFILPGFRHVTGRASSICCGWKISRPTSSRLARRNAPCRAFCG